MNPDERLSATEALTHPWLKENEEIPLPALHTVVTRMSHRKSIRMLDLNLGKKSINLYPNVDYSSILSKIGAQPSSPMKRKMTEIECKFYI